MRAFAAAIALILVSCTTYSDIVDREPFRAETVHGSADVMRDCVLDRLRRDHPYGEAFISARIAGAEHISAAVDGGSSVYSYLWDIAFVPMMGSGVRVEVRTRTTPWRGNPVYPEDLWPTVMGCAQG